MILYSRTCVETPYSFSCIVMIIILVITSNSKNCAELYKSGPRISGVYIIDPAGSGAFNVFCDQTTSDGGVDSLSEENGWL